MDDLETEMKRLKKDNGLLTQQTEKLTMQSKVNKAEQQHLANQSSDVEGWILAGVCQYMTLFYFCLLTTPGQNRIKKQSLQ